MNKNKLSRETSPYLLQHQDNPVHWYPWGEEALLAAQDSGKPILLSIGYASCHWCHVMAHESFEAEDIAQRMNAAFINIKVDREERPDLDIIYQSALALMQQPGGWPLTMFLTPDGDPFWGGTYFPPEERSGQPGFKQVIDGISTAWHSKSQEVRSNVALIRSALDALSVSRPGKALNLDLVNEVASATLRTVDPRYGGFRGAPKFPQVPRLRLLWRAWRRTGLALYFDAVTNSLDHMCQGGIFDHIGGGFARYSTDERWHVPHFEKMLCDNAQLIQLMCEVWKETRSPLYEARVRETVAWVLRDMKITDDDGRFAFASALDADTPNRHGHSKEGRFYVWQETEIDRLLGAVSPLFKKTYGVCEPGNWPQGGDGANVLARGEPYPADPAIEDMLATARHLLFKTRTARPQPARDDKVLADLNGLMIFALAQAATTFNQPQWLNEAREAFAFVSSNMVADGRLARSWARGRARHTAVLDDLAHMSRAALYLYQVTGEEPYLAQCEAWVHQAGDLFWCSDDGGYCFTARDVTDVITRTRQYADNARPSGNGIMADVLAGLYFITGQVGYRHRAENVINAFPAENADSVANMPSVLNAFEYLNHATQVVVVCPSPDSGETSANENPTHTQLFIDAVLGAPSPLSVLIRSEAQNIYPADHPAHNKTAIDGKPTAYLCRRGTCSAPINDVETLKERLKKL